MSIYPQTFLKHCLCLPTKQHAGFNLLRPETVESLYYMWYYTGEEKWRQYGRKIFDAFEKHSRRPFGYTALEGLEKPNVAKLTEKEGGKMETFWIAETLKYLLLLFSDRGLVDLGKVVFTTEAHPMAMFGNPTSIPWR